ncbi:chondroitinase family polysaccharide lyase [Pontiella sulfatireligans]|uniref:Chondroitin sulfate ABC endolyase n=1 Tax=Pontiella sulfatireligans TaxID=2750658 RepID=A0A6C2UNQ7_9BACT|nr:chondroitinase family polysaccharide lyase [Pontiella sulfatireligans]VGO20686.1 Chondroitin sulfate ABC endolyase [Pontiella sulfatireligans]
MNHQSIMCRTALMFTLFAASALQIQAGAAQGTIKEPDAEILSFETQANIDSVRATQSTFRQSDTLSMLGRQSLQWDWKAGASLDLPLLNYYSLKTKLSPFAKNQCLVLWIYNETPSAGHLTLSLGNESGFTLSCPFYLDYTGWRTAHIPLSQMQGDAPQMGDYTEFNQLRFLVPEDHPENGGRFFIDDVYTSVIDARHPSADYQAPYVRCFFNGSAHVTQWANQKTLPAKTDLRIKQIPVSAGDLAAFSRLYEMELRKTVAPFEGQGLSAKKFESALKAFEKTGVKEVQHEGKTYLQGPYIALAGQGLPQNLFEEGKEQGRIIQLSSYQNVLYSLAQSFHQSTDAAQREALKQKFMMATRAYLQSGWAAGSNMGALHHLGYNNRKIAPAFFMMKKELAEAGLLPAVSDSLNWFTVAHVVNDEMHTDPDLDLFNTVLYSHYLATMMRPDERDSARHVKLFAQWLSRTYADDTKRGGFRNDGTAWHHWGHYPAYTGGAIDNAVKVANNLTLAGFPLDPEGHAGLQRAVKTIMLYQQGDRYPRSLCGRHPLSGSHLKFIESDYTKTFVDLPPIDAELKALHEYHTADGAVSGNWTLPYSALSLHRRGDWLAGVRGFSIYTWGSEIYNFNRFGRYQSYGTLDILYKNDPALAYEGYDWNLNPGTTVTYLPLEELESPIPIWMVVGSTRFANGVHDAEHRNGAHGFDLDDAMLTNIDPGYEEIFTKEKLTARKSTFFMDDMILCLGTGISGKHPTAPVYTVLTQRGIDPSEIAVLINGEKAAFPCREQLTGSFALFDGRKTGYLVPGDNAQIIVSMKEQISRGDECTFDEVRKPLRGMKNGKVNRRREPETRGNFLAACIDHGVAPSDDRYKYIVFPSVGKDDFLEKADRVQKNPELFYRVISSKSTLHAVRDVRNGADTYICYEAQDMIPHAALHSVSEPSLLILKDEADGYAVSAALPDLHQPAFSREHNHKRYFSQPRAFDIVFEGSWTLDAADEAVSVKPVNGQTVITIRAQHGTSKHFRLSRAPAQ